MALQVWPVHQNNLAHPQVWTRVSLSPIMSSAPHPGDWDAPLNCQTQYLPVIEACIAGLDLKHLASGVLIQLCPLGL